MTIYVEAIVAARAVDLGLALTQDQIQEITESIIGGHSSIWPVLDGLIETEIKQYAQGTLNKGLNA